mgnify:CR=1 FL=1
MDGLFGVVKAGAPNAEVASIVNKMCQQSLVSERSAIHRIIALDGVAFAGNVKHLDGYLVGVGGRIDNLEELATMLGFSWGDSHACAHRLILSGLANMGSAFFANVYGDFCIAVYDLKAKSLTLARDVLGVVPVFYFHSSNVSLFAPTMQGLLDSGAVTARPNPEKIFLFLQGAEVPADVSCFKGVRRLPAAHYCSCGPGVDAAVIRYHYFEKDKSLISSCPEDNVNSFRKLVYGAVRARLPTQGRIGVELSGGLDSSTIFAIARDLAGERVLPFSGVFPVHQECDESRFIDAVCEHWGAAPNKFSADSLKLVHAAVMGMQQFHGLHNAANIHLSTEVFRRSAQNGCVAVFNGVDGDNVVSHGRHLLSELLIAGHREDFAQEVTSTADAFSRYSNNPEAYLARGFGIPALRYLREQGRLRDFFLGMLAVSQIRGVSRRQLITDLVLEPVFSFARFGRKSDNTKHGDWHGRFPQHAFSGDFLREVPVEQLLQNVPSPGARADVFEVDAHIAAFENGVNQHYFEYIWAISRTYNLRSVSPFMDRALLEFCIAIPAREKMGEGLTRLLQRRAMKGLLPEIVRTRAWKADLSASSLAKVRTEVLPLFRVRLGNNPEPLSRFVRIDYVYGLLDASDRQRGLSKVDAGRIWILFCLNEWLNLVAR